MADPRPADRSEQVGIITHGSLSQGVEMKLAAGVSVEDVKAGTFVVIQGHRFDFFSLITDVTIAATNENVLLYPPGPDDRLLRRVMEGTAAYAKVQLHPMLMLENHDHPELTDAEPRAVKTVPAHFSSVAHASDDDVVRIFGHETHEDGRTYFAIGSPLGMDGIALCLNMKRFVERSNAVFGKTGTGKTFLTRLLLCGLIRSGMAVNLIFDMHSEYGDVVLQEQESGGQPVFLKGLRDLFPSKVVIFSLDPQGTRDRGSSADQVVTLYADQILPGDILPLRDALNLTSTAEEVCHALYKRYRKQWLVELLKADGKEAQEELANLVGAHEGALGALYRKLRVLARNSFFSTESSKSKQAVDILDRLLGYLDRGKSVVFEFGRFSDIQVYLLVANVVTRRIRDQYEKKANEYRRTRGNKPRPLMITIEEAHKFLSKGVAHETPFGKIAREMRKYFVSLLVVDQRPSAIDDEVLSQIGTKLVAQLSDDKDIAAVLVGERNSSSLRNILATIDAKQQALLLGHATPMPMLIRSRTYDQTFFDAVGEGKSVINDEDSDFVW